MDIRALIEALKRQDFGPNDSQIISSLLHPAEAINRGGEWFRHNVSQAGGGDPYDNPYPIIGPTSNELAEASTNLAGLALGSSAPTAPPNNGATLGTFIGPKAKTWDAQKAALAEQLLNEGVDPAKVWKEHLIGRLPGKQLFSEIPDHIASITPNQPAIENGATVYRGKLNDLFHHVPLNKNYDLSDVKATLRTGVPETGSFTPGDELSAPWLQAEAQNIEQLKPGVLHEIQHAIQTQEGWPLGGSPKDSSPIAIDVYRRLTGEAQARATAKRADMSLAQRRENYPLAGDKLDDIPLNRLIDYYGVGPQKSKNLEDYVGEHRAPINSDSNAPLHDLTKVYPEDIYSNKALQYYGEGRPFDNESLRIMQQVKNKPDAMVTVYRTVPKDIEENELNAGDWVTLSKSYAKEHGKYLNGHKIIAQKVPAKTLFTDANSIHELGYDPSVLIDSNVQKSISELPETEYSLAHKIAQEHAALPVEQGGLGLPPNNTAMDRAKALGFDTEAYHKTDADIKQFKKKYSGINTIGNAASKEIEQSAKLGHWFSSSPLPDSMPGNSEYPVILKMESPAELSNRGNLISQLEERGLKGYNKYLNDYGIDSLLINKDNETKASNMVMRNNQGIRSRFAAFDPFKKDSVNILASILAGTTLASQMGNKK